MTAADDTVVDRKPVARRDLDELEEITREYARLTEREVGAWTGLASGLWIVGAEYLFQASPIWGRLAFLALVPASLAFYLLEQQLARPPHGAVAWAPKTQGERDLLWYMKIWAGIVAFLGLAMAALSLFGFTRGVAPSEVPEAPKPVAWVVFPLVLAAPAVAPVLTRRRMEASAIPLAVLLLDVNILMARWTGGEIEPVVHLAVLGLGCLVALLSLLWVWLRRMQLRMLDQRMAHVRSRLR